MLVIHSQYLTWKKKRKKKKKTNQVEQRIYLNSNKHSFNLLLQLFHKQCRNLVLSPRTWKYNFMLLWLHKYVQMLSLETNQINYLILPYVKYSIIKGQTTIKKWKVDLELVLLKGKDMNGISIWERCSTSLLVIS